MLRVASYCYSKCWWTPAGTNVVSDILFSLILMLFPSKIPKSYPKPVGETKWLVQRQRSFCSFWQSHIYLTWSSLTFKISVTPNIGLDVLGLVVFLSPNQSVLEVLSLWLNKEDLTIPHKAVEGFGWSFLDDLDAFKSEPLDCQLKWVARIFGIIGLPWRNAGGKKKFHSRHLKVGNWYRKHNIAVKYLFKHKMSLCSEKFPDRAPEWNPRTWVSAWHSLFWDGPTVSVDLYDTLQFTSKLVNKCTKVSLAFLWLLALLRAATPRNIVLTSKLLFVTHLI